MKISVLKKFLCVIFVLCVMSFPFNANGQATDLSTIILTPFGGRITKIVTCNCSGNFLVNIFDFRTFFTIPLIYQPGYSRLNSNYSIFYTLTLGQYLPGGQCLVTVSGSDCEPYRIIPFGTITPFPFAGVGTSAI